MRLVLYKRQWEKEGEVILTLLESSQQTREKQARQFQRRKLFLSGCLQSSSTSRPVACGIFGEHSVLSTPAASERPPVDKVTPRLLPVDQTRYSPFQMDKMLLGRRRDGKMRGPHLILAKQGVWNFNGHIGKFSLLDIHCTVRREDKRFWEQVTLASHPRAVVSLRARK